MTQQSKPDRVDIGLVYNEHLDLIAKTLDKAQSLLGRCVDAPGIDESLRSDIKKFLEELH